MSYLNNHYNNSSYNLLSELLVFVKKFINQPSNNIIENFILSVKAVTVIVFGKATLDNGIKLKEFVFKDENSKTVVIRFKKNHLIKFGITKDKFMFVEDYRYKIHVRESYKDLSIAQRRKLTKRLYNEYFILLKDVYDEYVINEKNDELTVGAKKFRDELMGDIVYVGIGSK